MCVCGCVCVRERESQTSYEMFVSACREEHGGLHTEEKQQQISSTTKMKGLPLSLSSCSWLVISLVGSSQSPLSVKGISSALMANTFIHFNPDTIMW